eukprot:m.162002 g.162002  ORF g.162002 m.162002 type:complete len:148 (-) comp14591_c0_seq3:4748-5191(-)
MTYGNLEPQFLRKFHCILKYSLRLALLSQWSVTTSGELFCAALVQLNFEFAVSSVITWHSKLIETYSAITIAYRNLKAILTLLDERLSCKACAILRVGCYGQAHPGGTPGGDCSDWCCWDWGTHPPVSPRHRPFTRKPLPGWIQAAA